jgi:branched-chain amino acid transport system substrate-binding protein
VGCLVPLSGEHAEFGRQVKNGLELASSQSGVALIIKDVGQSSQRTVAAVEELAANPQVLVLVGFFPTATADAAAQAAQRLHIPLLALTQKKDITLERPYVFRDFLTQPLMLQALLNYTAETMGWQRYAILYPTSKYGQSQARQFSEEAGRYAAWVVAQASYTEGGKDVAQAVQTLTQINHGSEGPPLLEAIFIPDEANVVAAIAKELAATPLLAHVHLLGTNILQTPAALPYSDLLDGILFADGFFAGDADPAVKAFVADYRQQFEQTPTYLAAQGYSSMALLAQAQKDSPELSRENFAQKLQHQTRPPGFSLFKEFNLDRETVLSTKIITIRAKEFQLAH